ncbi:MAG: hypothetical protein ACRCX2_38935 [Paraclostridium sp.]
MNGNIEFENITDGEKFPHPPLDKFFEYILVEKNNIYNMKTYRIEDDMSKYYVIHNSDITTFLDKYTRSKKVELDFSKKKLTHIEICKLPYYYRVVYMYAYYQIHEKNPGMLVPTTTNTYFLEYLRQLKSKILRDSYKSVGWRKKVRWIITRFGTVSEFTKWRKANERGISEIETNN